MTIFRQSQQGALAIGLCLKLLVLGALTTWGGFELADQINKWRLQPTLELSAVVHGAQAKWCYPLLDSTPVEDNAFTTFVLEQLPQFVTHVSHFQTQGRLEVTWQATPHNQCQFIFQKQGDRVDVKRRRFSQEPTIESGHPFTVKSKLDDPDVHVDQFASEDLGELKMVTGEESAYVSFNQVLSALKKSQPPEAISLTSNQHEFIKNIFSPASASASPSPNAGQPSVGQPSLKAQVMEWMYGANAQQKQDVYLERRD